MTTSRATAALLAVLLPACADLTEPRTDQSRTGSAPPATATATVGTAVATAAPPTPPPNLPQPDGDRVGASHVLVAYKGALRAAPTVTRTKEEAKKRAEDVRVRAQKGSDFADLAKQFSDDPTAKARGGSLGKFARNMMVKPFADAAFSLPVGGLSQVVETDFGYHVIKRTE